MVEYKYWDKSYSRYCKRHNLTFKDKDFSWVQKENNNQINVANSYWIAGEVRSFRREFDNIAVYYNIM